MIPLTLIQSNADSIAESRECGTCTACCTLPRMPTAPDFPEGKPGYTPCKYLRSMDGGCSIYDQRPEMCRGYVCMWRAGIISGDERRRPDRLGLMFVPDLFDSRIIVEVWELWDGAASEYPGRGVIESIAKKFRMAIRFYGVPASIFHKGADTFELGRKLSEWASSDPLKLADWLIVQYKSDLLEMPSGPPKEAALRDLDRLVAGETVKKTY